jgi:hypothetical protein
MFENLIPLFECSCQRCLVSASKGLRQLAEEVALVAADAPGFPVGHTTPFNVTFSEEFSGRAGLRVREIAAALRTQAAS